MTQNKKIIKIKKLLVRVFEQLSDSKVAVVNMCVLVNEFEIVRSVSKMIAIFRIIFATNHFHSGRVLCPQSRQILMVPLVLYAAFEQTFFVKLEL